jgi:hypothetical protein
MGRTREVPGATSVSESIARTLVRRGPPLRRWAIALDETRVALLFDGKPVGSGPHGVATANGVTFELYADSVKTTSRVRAAFEDVRVTRHPTLKDAAAAAPRR